MISSHSASQNRRFDLIEHCSRFSPEIQRNQHGHITTKSIDTTGIRPRTAWPGSWDLNSGDIVIQINHISPSMGIIEISIDISSVKFRMFCCPYMVPSGMIGNPVDQHFETHTPVPDCTSHLKSSTSTKFRICIHIVGTCIVTSERTQTPILLIGVMGMNQSISTPISLSLGKWSAKARKVPSFVYWRRLTS